MMIINTIITIIITTATTRTSNIIISTSYVISDCVNLISKETQNQTKIDDIS